MTTPAPVPAPSSPGPRVRPHLRRRGGTLVPVPSGVVRSRVALGGAVVMLAALVATGGGPVGAQASTTTPAAVAEADAEVARLRTQADALAERYFSALAQLADVQRQVDEVEARLPGLDAERTRLQDLANARAVTAYKRSGNAAGIGLVFEADDPLDAARRSQLLDRLNARDLDVVRQLRATTERLQDQRTRLREAKDRATGALDDVRAQGDEIDRLLAAAQARRQAAVIAAATTTTTRPITTRPTSPGGTGTVPGTLPPGYVPTPGVHPRHDEPFLVCTRTREARGNYQAVNPAGPYLGAYQFLPSTWNSVANHTGRTELIGVPPHLASPYDQDDLAWALFQWQGARPWGGLCTDA